MARNFLLEEDSSSQAIQHSSRSSSGEKRSRDEQNDSSLPLAAIKGIKKHARYEPVVPLPKHELTKWRKEARRVRNRESAAASRRKTRERIEELEGQVATLESQYKAALERIAELEQATSTTNTISPCLSSRPTVEESAMNDWSLEQNSWTNIMETLADNAENNMKTNMEPLPSLEYYHNHHQHPNLMISRPTAVCVN